MKAVQSLKSLSRVGTSCKRSFSTFSTWNLDKPSEGENIGGTVERLSQRSKYTGGVQGVILDWAGTTVDAHVLSPAVTFQAGFEKMGVPVTMEEVRGPMGLRKDLHIKKMLELPAVRERWKKIRGAYPTEHDLKTIYDDFVPMQCEVLKNGSYGTVLPGVAEAIQTLQKRGIKIGTTTGFIQCMVDILLEDSAKQGYVPDSTVPGDGVEFGMGYRPAPFMLYKNLLNMKVWPAQSVVKVDDTVDGVGEGLSAGCWGVGVYGVSNYTDVDSLEQWNAMSAEEQHQRKMNSRDVLLASGAHYIAETTAELPTIIDDINRRLANGEQP